MSEDRDVSDNMPFHFQQPDSHAIVGSCLQPAPRFPSSPALGPSMQVHFSGQVLMRLHIFSALQHTLVDILKFGTEINIETHVNVLMVMFNTAELD